MAKAPATYHLSYRAAFAYPALARIEACVRPVLLIAAADDPLSAGTLEAAGRAPAGRFTALPSLGDPENLAALAGKVLAELAEVDNAA